MAKGCGGAVGCRFAPTILRRVRRLAASLLLAALAVGGCAGGDDKQSVDEILDQAFRQEITSADLKVEAGLDLKGGASAGRPARIEASGPFRSNEGKLPSMDIEIRVGSEGAGQTIETGFLSTGDRAFVKFQDVFYEQPRAEVRRANRAIARNQRKRGSLRALGLNPRSWLGRATDQGEDEIAGVQTRHVAGTLDVAAVMRNLNEFVRRSKSALGGATGQNVPDPLSEQDIQRIGEVVRDPSFDIYVGKEDHIIRRVSGRLEFEVPEQSRQDFEGLESGTFTFSVEMSNVNGDQKIEAPAKARPLSALTNTLGADALEGLGGAGGGQDTPAVPNGPPPPDAQGGSSPEAEAFRKYADCLDKARPEDTEALQKCAELLHP
jgi:hypothetical protein